MSRARLAGRESAFEAPWNSECGRAIADERCQSVDCRPPIISLRLSVGLCGRLGSSVHPCRPDAAVAGSARHSSGAARHWRSCASASGCQAPRALGVGAVSAAASGATPSADVPVSRRAALALARQAAKRRCEPRSPAVTRVELVCPHPALGLGLASKQGS